MGTRSLTIFEDGGEKVAVVYQQYDGYPSGVGKEIADFLLQYKVVNGWSGDGKAQANGVGCLAALFVKEFKNGCGGLYLYPLKFSENVGEEFVYTIYTDSRLEPTHTTLRVEEIFSKYDYQLKVMVIEKRKILFEGLPIDYDKWLEKYQNE